MLQVGCPISLSKEYSLGKAWSKVLFPHPLHWLRHWNNNGALRSLWYTNPTSNCKRTCCSLPCCYKGTSSHPVLKAKNFPVIFCTSLFLTRHRPVCPLWSQLTIHLRDSTSHPLQPQRPKALTSDCSPQARRISVGSFQRAHHFISMACLSSSCLPLHDPNLELPSRPPSQGLSDLIPGLSLTPNPLMLSLPLWKSAWSWLLSTTCLLPGTHAQCPGLQDTCAWCLSVGSYSVANRAWQARCGVWICLARCMWHILINMEASLYSQCVPALPTVLGSPWPDW